MHNCSEAHSIQTIWMSFKNWNFFIKIRIIFIKSESFNEIKIKILLKHCINLNSIIYY